ncbi:MAG: hypothetical protein ACRCXM_17225 [Beijerinckiaceae bacterium]
MPFTVPEALMRVGVPAEVAKLEAQMMGLSSNLQGTFTLNGSTNVVVNNANLKAGDQIIFTLRTVGGTLGTPPMIRVRTNGTGFQVNGAAADTSVYDYRIMKGEV